jgi:hypothetical protein
MIDRVYAAINVVDFPYGAPRGSLHHGTGRVARRTPSTLRQERP